MNPELKEQVLNEVDAYDIVIDVNSISNITKGWDVKMSEKGRQRYQEQSGKKSCVVGVVGNKNKGKSFLLTKLAGIKLPSGHSLTTKGLSVKYPTIDQQNIVLLDTAGLETPITSSTEVYDLKKELENKLAEEKKEFDESLEGLPDDDGSKERKEKEHEDNLRREILSKFTTDKQITEYFLQTFILQESHILIFLVEQLTYSDQKLLNRIKNECKGKKLFVVHNLYTLTTKQQVEEYIENTLMKSLTFKLKKIKMTEFDEGAKKEEAKKEDVNQYFWAEEYMGKSSDEDDTDDDDKGEIIHYIMANDNSEAGKYYNAIAIKLLQNQIKVFSNTDVFPIQDRLVRYFVKKSGDLIDGARIKKEDMSTENKKISLKDEDEEEPREIHLKKCLIDELGFSKFQGSLFTPCYKHYINEDKTRFIIEIELPGSVKNVHFNLKIDKNGNYLFMFTGRKEFYLPSSNILTLKTIDKGKFELVLRVPMSDINLKDTKIKEMKRENGIQRVEFELKPQTKIEEDEYDEPKPIEESNE